MLGLVLTLSLLPAAEASRGLREDLAPHSFLGRLSELLDSVASKVRCTNTEKTDLRSALNLRGPLMRKF